MSNWRALLNSVDITSRVSSWSVSYAAENICGECTVEIADRDVLAGIIVPRVPRELSIQIDELVDGSWASRGTYYLEQITTPPDLTARTATIWGRSASARLTAPWAPKVSKQWASSTAISAIVTELAALCGVSVTVTNDFPVCANCYVVADQYPSEIIRGLADLSGQIVHPMVDGSVTIAPRLYAYGEPTVELDAAEIIVESVDRTAPDFGNRVLVAAPSTVTGGKITIVPQYPESACVEANGQDQVRLIAVVSDKDGAPVESGTVQWGVSAGTLAATTTSIGEATIVGEEVNASSFTRVELSLPATRILGVYAYADRSRRRNLYQWRQGSVDGNGITFASALDYYDQSLRVDYVVEGAATNTWTAGRGNADVLVTAYHEGTSGSMTIHQGQSAECPTSITMEAHPPVDGACMRDTVPITVAVIRDGRAPGSGLATLSVDGCGELSSVHKSLGEADILEDVQVYSVGSESQVQLRAVPVGNVYLTDAEGTDYTQFVDRNIVTLTAQLPEGTVLRASYRGGGVAITSWWPGQFDDTQKIGDVPDCNAEVHVYIADGSERGMRASVSVSARDCRIAVEDPEDPDKTLTPIDPCNPETWPQFDPNDESTWPVSWNGVNPTIPGTWPRAFDYCDSTTWPPGFQLNDPATWPAWMGTGFNPMVRSTWPKVNYEPTKPSVWPQFDPWDRDTWPASVPQTTNFGDPSTWPEGYDPCDQSTWPTPSECDPFDGSTLPGTWTGNEDPCDYTTWPVECMPGFDPNDPCTWPDDWPRTFDPDNRCTWPEGYDPNDPSTWPPGFDPNDPSTWPDGGPDFGDTDTWTDVSDLTDPGDDPADGEGWPDPDGGSSSSSSSDPEEPEEPEVPDPTSCTESQIVARTPAYAGNWAAVAGVSSVDDCPGNCSCDQICSALRNAGKLGGQFYSQCVYGCSQARQQQCTSCTLTGPTTLNPGEVGTWVDNKGNSGEASGDLTLVSRTVQEGYKFRMPTGGGGPFKVRACYGSAQSQCCEAQVAFPPCTISGPSELAPGQTGDYIPSNGMSGVSVLASNMTFSLGETAVRAKLTGCDGALTIMYGGQICGTMHVDSTIKGEAGFVAGESTMGPGETAYFAVGFASENYDGLTYTGTLKLVDAGGHGAILMMPENAAPGATYTVSWAASCGRSASMTVSPATGTSCANATAGGSGGVPAYFLIGGECYTKNGVFVYGRCGAPAGTWHAYSHCTGAPVDGVPCACSSDTPLQPTGKNGPVYGATKVS